MNNNLYLIHEEDYIKHIDEKVMLYSFVQQLTHHIGKMKPTRANEAIMKMAEIYGKTADKMFDAWGIPKAYLVFAEKDDLADLMENELIAPEDAGYFACDCEGERCCEICDSCCCDDDEDEEDTGEEDVFAAVMSELSEVIHSIFGDHVTISINIE